MDRESLTLIINGFDKKKFEQTTLIVLQDILGISASNEDNLIMKKGVRKSILSTKLYCLVLNKNTVIDSLTSAQIDLMRTDYNVDWNEEDSKKVATLLAFSAIDGNIRILREVRTQMDHAILGMAKGSDQKIINYLRDEKGLDEERANEALEDLAQIAATHPLIIKISRACVYLALEGTNPLSSAQALGAKTWKDFNIMLEPTVAIPYICSLLYKGDVTESFERSVNSVKRAITLTSKVCIPYSYINECAGHLLSARKYNNIELDPDEMIHSNNAFVSNYYSMIKSGTKLPSSFMEYLATFSAAIKTERTNTKTWVREIMTDITSLLMRGGVSQESIPFYKEDELKEYENEYSHFLSERNKEKPGHLIHHDTIALKYTNDSVNKNNEHWVVLSYDSILTKVGNQSFYKGWICSPRKFLDMTNISLPLSETQMISVLHSIASFSERTLAIGAKIMDRIIQYASSEMQSWEFKRDLDNFKKEMKASLNSTTDDIEKELITRTDQFLKDRGIAIKEEEIDLTVEDN